MRRVIPAVVVGSSWSGVGRDTGSDSRGAYEAFSDPDNAIIQRCLLLMRVQVAVQLNRSQGWKLGL